MALARTGIIGRRVQRLRQEREKRNAEAVDWGWYNFRITPTCPPSKQLYMRGGLLWNPYVGNYYAWQVPDGTCDLTDTDQVFANYYARDLFDYGTAPYLEWQNPYYYKVYTLALRLHDWDPDNLTFVLCESYEDYADEFETAAEAEAAWPATFSQDNQIWYSDGHPLCGLILRNDGVPGFGHFQAIDAINRGRSYIWPRDVRPLDYTV